MTISPEPPEFRFWPSRRLEFLLEEYQAELAHSSRKLGLRHPNTILYMKWIDAMREELARREGRTLPKFCIR
jgi:hypothetical protein